MAEDTILMHKDGGIATVTLNRPEALNAFTIPMHQRMRTALDIIESDKSLRVLVLTGAGRAFCAGQDLAERNRAPDAPPPDLGGSLDDNYNPLIRRLAGFPIPTIAAVNGVAAGAGCGIALACDLVLAARSARFILSFAKVGLGPDCGISWVLPRLIGQARALGMALTGTPLDGVEAERAGMIWRALDGGDLMDEALALARQLADGPAEALGAIKGLMRAGLDNRLGVQLDLERDSQRALGFREDYLEGVKAFMEKRNPAFKQS